MKKAKYRLVDGQEVEVSYDPMAPCRLCGLPVIEASVGGTDVCPWCDAGVFRNGEPWTYRDAVDEEYRKKRAREKLPGPGALD